MTHEERARLREVAICVAQAALMAVTALAVLALVAWAVAS